MTSVTVRQSGLYFILARVILELLPEYQNNSYNSQRW
jgi:hypothetical protein